MYFAWKLNKHYIQPWCTSFLILNQSISDANYCFLCCIQVSQEAGKVVWYSHLFQNFPCLENLFVVIHTVKDFSTVNETEVVFFFFLPPGIPLLFIWSNRWRFDLWVNHELVIFRLMKAFPVFSFIFVAWCISLVFPHIVYYRSILFCFCFFDLWLQNIVKRFKIFALLLKFNMALLLNFSRLFYRCSKTMVFIFVFPTLYLYLCVCVCSHTHAHPRLHPTVCGPIDCSPQGSSAHRIFQARILEWDTISSSRRSSPPKDGTLLHLLHWQADSLPPAPPGSPHFTSIFFMKSAWRKI